jgi:uncharacterized membrane protein YsdA (DUF1294 family)
MGIALVASVIVVGLELGRQISLLAVVITLIPLDTSAISPRQIVRVISRSCATSSSTDNISQTRHPIHKSLTMPPNRPKPRRRPWTIATIAGIVSLILPTCSLFRLYTSTHSIVPLAWTCVTSGVTFLFYGYDKMQARNMEWRVKEMTLHVLALTGGWPGALVGMHYFQHKTRKTSFQVVFWATVLTWQGVWWNLWTGGLGAFQWLKT